MNDIPIGTPPANPAGTVMCGIARRVGGTGGAVPVGGIVAPTQVDHPGPSEGRRHTLDIEDLLQDARQEVTRSLTDSERRQYLHTDTCSV